MIHSYHKSDNCKCKQECYSRIEYVSDNPKHNISYPNENSDNYHQSIIGNTSQKDSGNDPPKQTERE